MRRLELLVPEEARDQRLDSFLAGAEEAELSRSAAQQLIREGKVLCDGTPAAKNARLRPGQRLLLEIPDPQPVEAIPQDIPLDIVFEDADLLVVNKPKGMVVHPAPGNPDGTLVNALLWHCRGSLSGIGGELRPGIVHRIDKDTSGLLVVAKSDAAHQGLAAQMATHSIERVYHAVAYGGFRQDEGFVEAPIGRHKTDRKRMTIVPDGRYAYTAYRVLGRYPGFTHLACQLRTGRTHQIRVHMASIGHPLAGDPVYGPKAVLTRLQGQCLCAKVLGFTHPVSGEFLRFEVPLPGWFTDFLDSLGGELRDD